MCRRISLSRHRLLVSAVPPFLTCSEQEKNQKSGRDFVSRIARSQKKGRGAEKEGVRVLERIFVLLFFLLKRDNFSAGEKKGGADL